MNRSNSFIAIAVIAFSTMELAGKVIANQLNPFQLTFLRFLIGGLILLPFAIKEINDRNIRLTFKDFIYFAWTGFLCIIVSMSFFQLAIVYTKASIVAVIFSTNPIFTIPLAYLFLKEKITKSTFLALTASLAGIIFMINPFNTTPDLKGIIFAILSSLTFSLCSIAIKSRVGKYGALPLNCFSFILGDLMLFIFLLYIFPHFPRKRIESRQYLNSHLSWCIRDRDRLPLLLSGHCRDLGIYRIHGVFHKAGFGSDSQFHYFK